MQNEKVAGQYDKSNDSAFDYGDQLEKTPTFHFDSMEKTPTRLTEKIDVEQGEHMARIQTSKTNG